MSASDRKKFFLEKLEEQRHLLRVAIGGMAEGDLVQALHVATTIRVLVHESAASKPLLKQLDPNYLNLTIQEKEIRPAAQPTGTQATVFHCPVSARISFPQGRVVLLTGMDLPEYAQSMLGSWWGNACMVLPGIGAVTRKELILGLTNKEGGAHVDADISKKYQLLLQSKFLSIKLNDTEVKPVNVSRLTAGRAGVELLDCLDRNFPIPLSTEA